jgi:predicted RNA-binding Zn ribbon-like protein
MRQEVPRPPPLLLAGATALDFLNSIASPHGVPVEWIADGPDLIDWLVAVGLLQAGAAQALLRQCRRDELDRAAARARGLREWFRALAKRHAGAALPRLADNALRPLNAALAAERITRRLVLAGGVDAVSGNPQGYVLFVAPELLSADQLVALIAAEIAGFLCRADFRHVRFCEGHLCTVAFYDQSKNHRRRWCDMAVCGNRAKQARLRRQRV